MLTDDLICFLVLVILMTKEEFCRVLNKLRTHRAKIDAVEDILGVVLEDSLEDVVIDLLNEIMDLKGTETPEYGTDIDFFVYELDYGEKWDENSIKVDGETVDISTPEKLYDYLTCSLS